MRVLCLMRTSTGISIAVVLASLVACDRMKLAVDPLHSEITSDLTSLHTALVKYLVAHNGVWPQQPDSVLDGSEEKLLQWWTDQLRPYGAKDSDWYVSEQGAENKEYWKGDHPAISYIPTAFDTEPLSAYRWRNQPWLVTRFGVPGAGVLLPDGTAKIMPTMEEMRAEAKAEGRIEEVNGHEVLKPRAGEQGPVPISKIPEPLRHLAAGDDWKEPSPSAKK